MIAPCLLAYKFKIKVFLTRIQVPLLSDPFFSFQPHFLSLRIFSLEAILSMACIYVFEFAVVSTRSVFILSIIYFIIPW